MRDSNEGAMEWSEESQVTAALSRCEFEVGQGGMEVAFGTFIRFARASCPYELTSFSPDRR